MGACVTDSTQSKLYIFGGTNDNDYINTTYRYNFTTFEWEFVTLMPFKGHGLRGAHYKDTYWVFGVGGSYDSGGDIWVFNYTSQQFTVLWGNSSNGTIEIVPRLPTRTRSSCTVYDNNRNVFYISGGVANDVATPEGINYTTVFNITTYENGDYNNVWQYDIDGVDINPSYLIEEDFYLYYGACGYKNDGIYQFGGTDGGPPLRNIVRFVNV